jgi:hypothetical protein
MFRGDWMDLAMTDRALIFTGLVRDERRFVEFLEKFRSLPSEERPPVYFSTWVGELDKYPVAASMLRELGVIIFEQRQPDLLLPGHVLHQLIALDIALACIDPNTFVFKSRPDFADFSTYQSFVTLKPSIVTERCFADVSPRCRIHVMGCFVAHPFYINDITYCALAQDLSCVVSLPFLAMSRYHRVAPEQLIWGGNSIGRIRVLDRYFRVNTGLIFNDEEKARAHSRILKDYVGYAYALAAYFLILNSYFSSIHPPIAGEFDFVGDATLDDLLWGRVDAPSVVFHATAYTNAFRKIGVVEKILRGEFQRSDFGDRVLEAISILTSSQRPQDYLTDEIEASARTYCEAVKSVDVRGGKLMLREGTRFRVEGAGPGWAQQQTGTLLTEKLENEVNYLRRVVNDLQERLRKALP